VELVPAEGPILDEILSATFDIWHEGLTRRAYPRYYTGQLATAWGRTHLRRWALVDRGDVLASAKEYLFDATLDGRAIRVIGLGAVFTQPRHRGHGYARRVIEEILDRAIADGFDLALLFSEIGPEYYAPLGFTVVPTFDLELRVREDPRRGAPATLVRAGADRDLADLVSICGTRAAPYRFHLNRDRDLIQYGITKKRLLAGLSAAGARDVRFFVAEEGAAAAAYVVIGTRGPEWTIEAAGDRDPAGARLGAILQALIARDPAEPRPAIRAWLPGDLRPPQVEIVDERPSRDVMMIRPLTPKGTPAAPLGERDVLYWRSDLF
jgi:GNAT superfamily N-acetyltransferase